MKSSAIAWVAGLALLGCGEPARDAGIDSRSEPLTIGPAIELDPSQALAPITGGAALASVAAGDDGYLAVWCARNQPGGREGRYATRLSGNGDVLDDPPLKVSDLPCIPGDYRGAAAVAHATSGYVVVHQKLSSAGGTTYDLQATSIADDGTVGATQDVVVASGEQTRPALASSGGELLLVWTDRRSGDDDVYARRLSSQGAPLGTELKLAGATNAERQPAVIWDGTNYFVAWHHAGIEGVHVTPGGNVIESTPVTLIADGEMPTLSSAAGSVLLAYESSQGVQARLYDAGGATLADLTLATNSGGSAFPRATNTGSGFLVAWAQRSDGDAGGSVRAARISTAGVLEDVAPGIELGSERGYLPWAASDGSGAVVAWTGEGSGSKDQILAAIVPGAGAAEPPGLLMTDLNPQRRPSAAFDGTNHLVVWQSQSETSGFDLVGTRLGAGGAPLDAPPISLIADPGDQTDVRLARGSDSYLMTWTDQPSARVWAARLSDSGALIGQPAAVSAADLPASRSDIAPGPDGYLLTYVYSEDVVAQLMDAAGVPVGAQLLLGNGDVFANPAVAWGGYYLATWETDAGEVVGRRVTADGTSVDAAPFVIATQAEIDGFSRLGAPAVCYGGGVFLVVFNELGVASYAKRVALDGQVLDATPIVLPDHGRTSHVPSVRFDGSRFVVAYGGGDRIGIAYVETDGSVSSEQETFEAPPADQVSRTLQLSSECGGDTLAVFSRDVDDAPHERAYARRITPETSAAADCELPPAVAGSGGASGAGATGGTGGSVGGVGGTVGGSAGAPNAGAGGAAADADSTESSGCGCRVADRSSSGASWVGLLALGLLLRRRR